MKAHVKQWLQAWHDGELDESLVPVVEEHLRTCETCREELRELEQLNTLLHEDDAWLVQTITATKSEDNFVNAVMQQIHQDKVEQESFFDSMIWKSVPAALLGLWALVQGGWWLLRGLRVLSDVPVSASEMGLLNSILASIQSLSAVIEGSLQGWGIPIGIRFDNWIYIDVLFDTVLNPALIGTVIIGMMFASWFAIWWLRQEQRNKITQLIHNGG